MYKLFMRYLLYHISSVLIYAVSVVVVESYGIDFPGILSIVPIVIAASLFGIYYVKQFNAVPKKEICWKIALMTNIPQGILGILAVLLNYYSSYSPFHIIKAEFGTLGYVLILAFVVLSGHVLITIIVRYSIVMGANLEMKTRKKTSAR